MSDFIYPLNINLTSAEIIQGSIVGITRQIQNMQDNRKPAYGAGNKKDWQLNIEGALGEMALAKHLGLFWSKGNLGGSDVGEFEVRTTTKPSNRLILHDKDSSDAIFYLLTGVNGKYVIRGWIPGGEGKQKEYWSDPQTGRPAYFVPQKNLCKHKWKNHDD